MLRGSTPSDSNRQQERKGRISRERRIFGGSSNSSFNSRGTSMNASEIQLSDQQLRDLRQIFDWLDASGDEHITAQELLLALKASSPSATIEDAAEAIRNATGSTKTTLTWMEFVSVIEKALRKKDGSTAAQMFEMLDLKGTGQLGPNVLREALKRYGCDSSDRTIDIMIRYIDADGDGQVSLQEFANALTKEMQS